MRIKNLLLPDDYQEVEYIESTGTQCINLNFYATKYTKIDIDFMYIGSTSSAWTPLYGERGSASNKYFNLFINKSNNYISPNYAGFDPGVNSQTILTPNTRYRVRTDGGQFYLNEVLIPTCSTSNELVTTDASFYLFAYGTTTSYDNRGMKARIYSCKIYEGKQLIRKLIPCYRKSDDVAGLYDCINRTFYTHIGTGNFTVGNDVSSTLPFKVSLIPNIYQELDYIESAGGQGIIVNYKPISTDKIQSTFAMTKLNVTSCLWCARGSTTATNSLTSFYIANSGIRCDYGTSATMTQIGALVVNTKHTLLMNGNKWYLDGTLKTQMTAQSFTAGGKIRLFSSYTNGESSGLGNYSYIKLYDFKVWNKDDELQVHLIPCERKTDGMIGLYDMINGTFYANIGSGNFAKGSNITKYTRLTPKIIGYKGYPGFDISTYKKVEYLANSNGAQYLEIPFMPDCSKGFKFEFGFIPTATSKRYALMSNYNQGSYQLSLEINASNKLRLWLNTGNLDKASSNSFIVNQLNIGIFEFKNNTYKITLNGTETSGSYTCSYKSTTETMYAFLDKAKRTSTFPTPIKFTYIKIWEADKLVFNLVPCKTKNGSTYGMYDCVNQIFYSNKGTGSFTIGSEQDVEIM